jgi:putative chitinase
MKLPDSLKSVISSKILGKPKESSVATPEALDDKKEKVTPLKQIADNFAALPDIAKSLNITRQNIFKLVKLEGGEGTKADNLAPVAGIDTSSESKNNTTPASKSPTKKTVSGGKKGGIMSKLGPLLKVGAIIFALSQIPGGFIKDMFDGIVDTIKELASALWEEISTAFNSLLDTFKKWFNEVVDPILQQIKDFLKPIWDKITEFFKPIFDWIGEKVKSVVETLQPVFDFMKGIFDKVTGVLKALMDEYEFLRKGYDSLKETYSALTDKIEKAKNFLGLGEKKPEVPKEVKGTLQKAETTTTNNETAAEKAKKNLTPSQLRWLGGADATDPYIMARMPPPQPGEKGGPPAQPGQPAPQAPAGPPAAPPSQAPAAPSPAEKPSKPSDTKPGKISSQQGESIMIKALDDAKVTDPTARAAIMAQVGHESGNFTTLSENLNYKAPTLMKLFPKKFAGEQDAQAVAAGGPEKVAERLYSGRMGNAPEGAGEGFKYRGRGFVQLTGKQNYTKFGYASNPDAVAEPAGAAETAIKYMLGYKGDWSDITKVTKFVNGGTIGLEDRLKHFQAYKNDPKITTVGAASTVPSGGAVASASTQVASDQRQQQKPQTPVIINAPSTTNTNVVKNETKAAPVNTASGGANALLSRTT